MTDASQGWAFLVARGRRAGYRTVLAPGFLVNENLHHLLADATGTIGTAEDRARVVELANAQVGPFSIGYTSEQLRRADVEAGSDGGELLTDEHGRPLEIVYGVVSRDGLEGPLDAEDLRTARERALRSYRGFLADERGHRVDASFAFALRTRSHAPTVSASTSAVAREDAPTGPRRTDKPSSTAPRPRRAGLASAVAVGVALVVAGLLITIAGGDKEDSVVSPAWLDDAPGGPVRVCAAQDVSGSQRRSLSDYNRRFPGSKATLAEGSFTNSVQHDLYLELLSRRSDECDVISLDVIYMAEFADKDLLYDMTPYLAPDRRADFNDQMMRTAEYQDRFWGVPKQLDVGVLYYRADRVRAPSSWQDVYRQAKPRGPADRPGLRFQIGSSEGLMVVLLELGYAAGARLIVSEDGETANIDQPEVLEALLFLRNAIRDRVLPGTQQADIGSLSVYEIGRASFLRGWPFAAASIRDDANRARTSRARRTRRTTADNTEIVPLPPWRPGGRSVGVLGGYNLVIPRSARNPSAALHLIDYLTSVEQVRRDEREIPQFPVLKDVANDPDLRNRKLLTAMKRTEVIRQRPSIPEYAEVSRIISSGVAAVLRADAASAQDRLQEIERDVQSVLDRRSP